MTIIGMNYSTNSNGEINTTLHVTEDFDSYYQNPEAGRGCVGLKAETIYVGTYDVSNLKVGMNIEIAYEKAIPTKSGIYQPIKKIDIVSK